ncbi:MAG: hypothetical protein PHS41_07580, partial [Victivallaceae bacterium]|nr:hypothetical protein [Victivallaceae bacterium]
MSGLTRTHAAYPVKVIQFGEGNFLRAFIDWMIQKMNQHANFQGSVMMIQPLERGMGEVINRQDGLYTLILRGVQNGKIREEIEVIESVRGCVNACSEWSKAVESMCIPTVEFVFSNTTEAGIEYKEEAYTPGVAQKTYPAKLTSLLLERFRRGLPGVTIIPCELIDKNGATLRKCMTDYARLWNLPLDFSRYLEKECRYYNSLVDRIVEGYPRDEAAEF